VVTTYVDDSLNASRQTELDQILDEIVRDIDLLDQTLADGSGQCTYSSCSHASVAADISRMWLQ